MILRAASPNGILLYQEWVFMSRCFLLPTCKPRPWQTFAVPILEEDLTDSPPHPPKLLTSCSAHTPPSSCPELFVCLLHLLISVLRGCIEECCQTQKEQVQGMPCMLVQVVCYINGAP